MRDRQTFPKRWRALCLALLLLLLMSVLGSCAAGGARTPTRSGAQATPALTPTPVRQARVTVTHTPPRRVSVTPTHTPKRQATATLTRTPTDAASPTSTRRAPAKPTIAPSGLPTIGYDRLPSQARETIDLIQRGGPFPYRQDGAVFQNRERLLPAKPNGYYHEYTVVTPGSPDRGARRIIAGEKGELYYTDDHYASFKQVIMP